MTTNGCISDADCSTQQSSSAYQLLPPDDPTKELAVARLPPDEILPHVGIAGNTYAPGPAPHRLNFVRFYTVLESKLEFSFRSVPVLARGGESITLPANAPHRFRNVSEAMARLPALPCLAFRHPLHAIR